MQWCTVPSLTYIGLPNRADIYTTGVWEQVPWGARQLVLGMGAWTITFVAVGIYVVPLLVQAAGVRVGYARQPVTLELLQISLSFLCQHLCCHGQDFSRLTAQDKAVFALVNQVCRQCSYLTLQLPCSQTWPETSSCVGLTIITRLICRLLRWLLPLESFASLCVNSLP